jgi:hypothetical protein
MKDYFSLVISFPGIDFDQFMSKSISSNPTHHAHLYSKREEIELRIYYESKTYFGRKLSLWASKINWKDFGSFITSSDENQNHRLKKVDFSNSSLLGITTGTAQIEGNLEYVSINIDSIKMYWSPSETEQNSAEFYFNDNGFNIVSEYYAPLFGSEGEFKISRMKGLDEFYKIGMSEFRPEFEFPYKDNKNGRESKITKEPILKFRYKEAISELEVYKYAEIIRLLASFYLHCEVDYSFSRIRMPQFTITLKKIQKVKQTSNSTGLASFKIYWNFHEFMKSNWEQFAFNNFLKLSKVIDLFNQSFQVDDNSMFLIRYNIIEICMGGNKIKEEKFQFNVGNAEKNKIYKEVTLLLLRTIKPEDHKDFLKKLKVAKDKLTFKPMKSPLLIFLENQRLMPSTFPLSLDEIKGIRDSLTHGSLDKINHCQLEKANTLLYRITGILILNLLGISEWTLETNIG